jgi:hypothetical protein
VFWPFSSRKRKLSGAPATRRLKTYAAQTGYVYDYYFEGSRTSGAGTEFVFSVSASREKFVLVTVIAGETAFEAWQAAHDRQLSSTERYAVAKMALFQAFDERASPDLMKQAVKVRPADVDAIAEQLGFA